MTIVAKRKSFSGRRVQARQSTKTRFIGSLNSTYAGKFNGTKKLDQYKKSIMEKGAMQNTEVSGVLTNTTGLPLYIGHATNPTEISWQMMWKAIIKKLYYRMGLIVTNMDTVPYGINDNDKFDLELKTNYETGTGQTVLSYVKSLALPGSINDVAENFANQTSGLGNQIQLIRILFLPVNAATKVKLHHMDLKNARIHMYSKSTLLLQNRTKAADDDDNVERVDAVPVVGKVYSGNGTGTQMKIDSYAKSEFVANHATGLIKVKPASSNEWRPLYEPPDASMFAQVKGQGKIHMDPGQMKSSSIKVTKTISVNSFVRQLLNVTNTIHFSRFGQFKFYGFEKQIDAFVNSTNIAIAYENNTEIGCYLLPGHDKYTSEQFEKIYETN